MTKTYGLPCPVARSLDIVGDRWTLLIVRDLLTLGPRKYVELQQSLRGIAPNVLSERLKLLEEHGIVEREFYEEHPPRARYRITRKGAGLRTVLQAFLEWGNKHLYDGVTAVHETCGHDVKLVTVCEHCGERVAPRETKMKYRRREAARAVGLDR
ncbi:MAG TPA: helix-turn-helix domain-containing protein [Dehalococcoidia bacterium]|nr:helix-turn-helix domain-containing protein [Dehalococcoidia bacterium]